MIDPNRIADLFMAIVLVLMALSCGDNHRNYFSNLDLVQILKD